ncbi:MAG: DUF721 domain-containing protein [Bdellovibrio sp.]|nr:MAG: DUF721 domain-containing protein [Bdellovibrio sp.]
MENDGVAERSQLQRAFAAGQTPANHCDAPLALLFHVSSFKFRIMEKNKSSLKGSAEVLQSLFQNSNSPLAGPFLRWKLWKQWPEIVGATVAEFTEPVGLRRGTLVLWVRNSSWLQQLVFLKDQIKGSVNKKLGSPVIKNISFTLNRNMVPSNPEEKEALRARIQSWS